MCEIISTLFYTEHKQLQGADIIVSIVKYIEKENDGR